MAVFTGLILIANDSLSIRIQTGSETGSGTGNDTYWNIALDFQVLYETKERMLPGNLKSYYD